MSTENSEVQISLINVVFLNLKDFSLDTPHGLFQTKYTHTILIYKWFAND